MHKDFFKMYKLHKIIVIIIIEFIPNCITDRTRLVYVLVTE